MDSNGDCLDHDPIFCNMEDNIHGDTAGVNINYDKEKPIRDEYYIEDITAWSNFIAKYLNIIRKPMIRIQPNQRINTLRRRQRGQHFPEILECISLNQNAWISLTISMKYVPTIRINDIHRWYRYLLGADQATIH